MIAVFLFNGAWLCFYGLEPFFLFMQQMNYKCNQSAADKAEASTDELSEFLKNKKIE